MTMPRDVDDRGGCPFLVPVVADRLWMRPLGAYCRRPGRSVRIPAAPTLARFCTAQYRRCDRYSESSAAGRAEPNGYRILGA